MLEHVIDIVEIEENLEQGILKHEVQFAKIKDGVVSREINMIMFYGGHDAVVGDNSYDHPQKYCLKIYKGNKSNVPLHSPFLKDYDDEHLKDLAQRSDGKLTLAGLRPVRDLVRQLFEQNQINRIATKCNQCMRQDFQVAQAQRDTS